MGSSLSPEKLFNVGLGFWASKVLLAAVKLGLFTELAKGPLAAEDLRRRLGLHPRSYLDFFDALVSMQFLRSPQDGAAAKRLARGRGPI